MDLPAPYGRLRKSVPFDQIEIGIGGIKLFPPEQLEDFQLGYSVRPDGKSLCSSDPGAWQSNWIVIGNETGCGDPLFIDTADTALPVLTAMHGEGSWEPKTIAISFEAFTKSLNELAKIAGGRSGPLALENNPLPPLEREAFLNRIMELNYNRIDLEFWFLLTEF